MAAAQAATSGGNKATKAKAGEDDSFDPADIEKSTTSLVKASSSVSAEVSARLSAEQREVWDAPDEDNEEFITLDDDYYAWRPKSCAKSVLRGYVVEIRDGIESTQYGEFNAAFIVTTHPTLAHRGNETEPVLVGPGRKVMIVLSPQLDRALTACRNRPDMCFKAIIAFKEMAKCKPKVIAGAKPDAKAKTEQHFTTIYSVKLGTHPRAKSELEPSILMAMALTKTETGGVAGAPEAPDAD